MSCWDVRTERSRELEKNILKMAQGAKMSVEVQRDRALSRLMPPRSEMRTLVRDD